MPVLSIILTNSDYRDPNEVRAKIRWIHTDNDGKDGVLEEEWWPIGAFQDGGISREKLHPKSKMVVKMELPNGDHVMAVI